MRIERGLGDLFRAEEPERLVTSTGGDGVHYVVAIDGATVKVVEP